MTETEVVCEECRAGVSKKATRCPHCGLDAGADLRKGKSRWNWLGIICAFTLVGLPLALVCWAFAWQLGRKAKKQTVGVAP